MRVSDGMGRSRRTAVLMTHGAAVVGLLLWAGVASTEEPKSGDAETAKEDVRVDISGCASTPQRFDLNPGPEDIRDLAVEIVRRYHARAGERYGAPLFGRLDSVLGVPSRLDAGRYCVLWLRFRPGVDPGPALPPLGRPDQIYQNELLQWTVMQVTALSTITSEAGLVLSYPRIGRMGRAGLISPFIVGFITEKGRYGFTAVYTSRVSDGPGSLGIGQFVFTEGGATTMRLFSWSGVHEIYSPDRTWSPAVEAMGTALSKYRAGK